MIGTTNNRTSWLNWAQRSRDEGGLGLAPHQAAGVVGNLIHESGQDLNPWGPTGDNGTAWGTAQWRGDRLARLKARPDYQTIEGQQAFMREELDGSENKAYKALLASQTPEEAAHAWDSQYERSDGSTREQRMRSARDLMAQFGGDTAYQPGALTTSFAPTGSKPSMPPALSSDNTLGKGILNMGAATGQEDDPISRGLVGMGAAIAGISSPEQAKALTAAQTAMLKAPGNKWSVAHVDPKTGQALLTNGSSFVPWSAFQPKPDDDEYVTQAKKEEAKAISAQGNDIHNAANAASAMAPDLATLERVINTPGVEQGILGPARNTLNKIYTTFGFGDPKAATDADLLSSIGSKTALQVVQNGGTKILPGSFSNSDRDLVLKMGNGEGLTHDANKQLLEAMKIHNKRLEEVDALRQANADKNGGYLTPSFRKDLADLRTKWAEENKARDEANSARAPAAATAAKTPAIDHSAIDAELARREALRRKGQ